MGKAAFSVSLLVFALLSSATHPPGDPAVIAEALSEGGGRPPLEVGSPAQPSGGATDDCRRGQLSLLERAGQVVMAGVPGSDPTPAALGVARLAGAVVLQGHNVEDAEQLVALTSALHRAGNHRLLVAVDEEGGRVSRLGDEEIVAHLPPARTLGATAEVDQVRELGRRLGERMLELGIDWNLAPVLDVTAADANTVIGDRSYGADPATVSALGRAFAEGLAAAGVVTTGKHFPGHGATAVDSHETLPVVRLSLQALEGHLQPYREALPVLDTVMTAHIVFTALDPHRPASLSPAATRLLRSDIGFRGVLITDALEMAAVTGRWAVPRAAELAIRAGADMVLVGPWQLVEPTVKRLAQAARADRVPAARLDQAVARVLALKGYSSGPIDCMLG